MGGQFGKAGMSCGVALDWPIRLTKHFELAQPRRASQLIGDSCPLVRRQRTRASQPDIIEHSCQSAALSRLHTGPEVVALG